MAKRICKLCNRECKVPQTVDRLNLERRRGKRGQLLKERMVPRRQTLCGWCYAYENTKGDPEMATLQERLLELAKQELEARPVASRKVSNGRATKAKPANHRKARVAQPQMTAQEATSFDGISIGNALLVEAGFECDCLAYVDIFTYKRWLAQGFQVSKGSKAVTAPRWLFVDKKREDGVVEQVPVKVLGSSSMFCRHQVSEIKEAVVA